MKNVHILPTTQPSKLYISFDELRFNSIPLSSSLYKTQYIYITNEEEINDGDHYINFEEGFGPKCYKYKDYGVESLNINNYNCKKIVLTNNPLLINDGVQAIDDRFLKWFVENPYTEYVEVKKEMYMPFDGTVPFEVALDESLNTRAVYEIITEQPKQETLEDAAERAYKFEEDSAHPDQREHKEFIRVFIKGAKYQEKRMYNETDMKQFAFESVARFLSNKDNKLEINLVEVISDRIDETFNEFKNKK